MKISRERLMAESRATGFLPEVLEKVIYLLALLSGFNRHPTMPGESGGYAMTVDSGEAVILR